MRPAPPRFRYTPEGTDMLRLLALIILLSVGAVQAQPYWRSTSVDSASLDSALCSTRGSVVYRNATTWVCLGVGSDGDLLKSGGAGADVSWYTAPTLTGTPAAGDLSYWTSS